MTECINYNISFLDLIFPPFYIFFFKLCTTRDKTKIFLISLFRICLIFGFFYYFNHKGLIAININKLPNLFLFIILLFYLLLNVIYILIILFLVKPEINSKKLREKAKEVSHYLINHKLSKPA